MYQVLILIVPFITTPYISRVLLAEGIGTYSITTTIAKYFWMFALLGMANYGNRTISKARDNKDILSNTFWNLFYFQAISSCIVLFLYTIWLRCYGIQNYNMIAVCQIPYILSAVFEISWFFYGTEQFKFMVFRNTIIKIITTIMIFLFVKKQGDVWIYVLINTLSLLLGQLCLWPFLLKQVYWVKPNIKKICNHLQPNLVLFVSVVAVSFYNLMDKIMIEVLSSRIELGYYENTEKIFNMVIGIVGAIGSVMLPRISYLMEKHDKRSIEAYLSKSMYYIMSLAIGITFGISGIAKEFAIVYFGKEFTKCGKLLMIIIFAVPFYSWENILRTQYLLPGNRDKIFVKGTIYAALANLLLNLFLIPFLGGLGAVYGTVVAQVAAAGYQSIIICKELPLKKYLKKLIPFFISGIFMFSYCRIIGEQLGSKMSTLIIQILGGGLIYIGINILYIIKNKKVGFESISKSV